MCWTTVPYRRNSNKPAPTSVDGCMKNSGIEHIYTIALANQAGGEHVKKRKVVGGTQS